MNSFYLKERTLLTRSDIRQMIHPDWARKIILNGNFAPHMNMSPLEIISAMEHGDLMLLQYDFLGEPLQGVQVIDPSISPWIRDQLENVCSGMPDLTPEEYDRQEQKREKTEVAISKENKCFFGGFKLVCQRSSRRYVFDASAVGAEKYVKNLGCLFQVVGAKTVDVRYDARCIGEKPICVSLDVTRGELGQNDNRENISHSRVVRLKRPGNVEITPAKLTSSNNGSIQGIVNFIKYGLAPDLDDFRLASYRFSNQGLSCEGVDVYSPKIEVFPKYEWKGKISMGMTLGMSTDKKKNSDFSWSIAPEIEGQFGPTKFNLKPVNLGLDTFFPGLGDKIASFKNTLDSFRDTKLDGIKNLQNKLIKHSDEAPMTCEIKVAHLTLEGAYKLKEDEQKPLVVFSRELKLGFDPLIEATVKMDLIPAIVQRYMGKDMAKFIKAVLKKASEDGIGTDNLSVQAGVMIELAMTGSIKGALVWEAVEGTTKQNAKKVRKTNTTKSAKNEVEVGLTFNLEAKVFSKARVWKVVFEAGMSAKATGAQEGSAGVGFVGKISASKDENGDPQVDKELTFTGLAIVLTVYGKISEYTDKSEDKNKKKVGDDVDTFGGPSPDEENKGSEDEKLNEEEATKFVLLNWWTWTKDGIKRPDANGKEIVEAPNEEKGLLA